MTPLHHVTKAAELFSNTENNPVYHFTVPDNKSMDNFARNIRTLAKKRGYKWRVSYWGEGRAWIIKQKI